MMNFLGIMNQAIVKIATGLSLGAALLGSTYLVTMPDAAPTVPPEPEPTSIVEAVAEVQTEEPVSVSEPEPVYMGTWRVTAYCACEKCCGQWALNRPGGIVYGAYGKELKAGVSCASTLPYGTKVKIEGLGMYTVQDKIASWVIQKYGNNQIDIYFDSHEAACKFGLQKLPVYLMEE